MLTEFKDKRFNNIIHISDIHIRNMIRKDEYLLVFKRLQTKLKKYSQNDTIVIITGDIVHSKLEVSNELFVMVSDFLKTLADLFPTVIMVGNHDMNLKNLDRIDSLTPIVKSLNHPNLKLIKYSGIYNYGNIGIGASSVIDDIDKIPKPKNIDNDYKIALYHGAVQGGVYDNDTHCDDGVEIKYFDGYDYTLLGDFHKRQFLKSNIWYVGSLIQQNFSESLDKHGFIHIDLKNNEINEIEIENDYGFYNVDIHNGKYDLSIKHKYPQLKLNFDKSDTNYINNIINEIKNIYALDNHQIRTSKPKTSNTEFKSDINLKNILKKDSQINILKEFLQEKLNLNDYIIEEILKLHNKYYNENIEIKNNTHNWRLNKLEFSGIFSYKCNSKIDFNNYSNTVGIFGENASGKSSILDILMFCIYDKCLKTSDAKDIINVDSDKLYCKLSVEINGISYYIERIGNKKKDGKVPITVNFYTDDKTLNGDKRSSTNKEIRKYFGEFDDFIMSVVIGQNKQFNFIDLTQSERKDLLTKFLNLGIYDKIREEIKIKHNDISSNKKIYEKDYISEINDIKNNLEVLIEKLEEKNNNVKQVKKYLYDAQSEKEKLQSNIINISNPINISFEKNKKNDINKKLNSTKISIKNLKSEIENLNEKNKFYKEQINNIDVDECKKWINVLEENNKKEYEYYKKKTELQSNLSYVNSQIELLSDYEYDSECKYCTTNKFVKEAMSVKDDKPILEEKIKDLDDKIYNLSKNIPNYDPYEKVNLHQSNNAKIQNVSDKINLINSQLETSNDLINNLKQMVSETESRINEGKNQIHIIEENEKLKEKIKLCKQKIEYLTNELSDEERSLNEINYEIKRQTEKIEELRQQNKKYIQILKQYDIYNAYLKSLSRDGLQLYIMEKVIDSITYQINMLLEDVVEFRVMLTLEDKNIKYYILYSKDDYWNVTNTSGMERFIINIVTRVAFSQLSDVSVPDFIFIDEGFGALDQKHLSNISLLLKKLTENYRFVILISHLLYLKDIVDNSIYVTKDEMHGSILNF